MVKRLLLLLLILTASASAQIGYGGRRAVGTNTISASGYAFLPAPRFQGGYIGDTCVVICNQDGSNEVGIIRSFDGGATWVGVNARWSYNGLWFPSDHACGWYDGDLHIANRKAITGQEGYYRRWVSPFGVGDSAANVDIYPETYIVNVVAYDDTVWVLNQPSDTADPIYMLRSTDDFVTIDSFEVFDPEWGTLSSQNSMRMGIVLDTNNAPVVMCIFYITANASDHGWYRFKWNGTDFDSTAVTTNAAYEGQDRGWTFNQCNGATHVLLFDDSEDLTVHWWETSPGVFDSTIATTPDHPNGLALMQLVTVGEAPYQSLYMVQQAHTAAGDTLLYVKRWDTTGTWVDSTRITAVGHTMRTFGTVPNIPSTIDSIPLFYQERRNDSVYVIQFAAEDNSPSGDTLIFMPDGVNRYPHKDTITSVPFVGTQDSTAYVLQADFMGQGMNGMAGLVTISADNAMLTSEREAICTLEVVGVADSQTVVYVSGDSVEINNIATIRDLYAPDSAALMQSCIFFSGGSLYSGVDSCWIKLNGGDVTVDQGATYRNGNHAIVFREGGQFMQYVTNSYIENWNGFYYRRSWYPKSCILVEKHTGADAYITDTATEYTCRIDGNTMIHGFAGAYITGHYRSHTGNFIVSNNTITGRIINDFRGSWFDIYPYGDCGAIVLNSIAHADVYGNTILADTVSDSSRGGNGMFLTYIDPRLSYDSTWRTTIHDNTFDCAIGPGAGTHASVIFSKYNPTFCSYYNNEMFMTDNGWGADEVYGLWVGDYVHPCESHWFYNNKVTVVASSDAVNASCLRFRYSEDDYDYRFYDNDLYSNDWFYLFFNDSNADIDSILFTGDTLSRPSGYPVMSGQTIGCEYNGNTEDIHFRSLYVNDGIDETSVYLRPGVKEFNFDMDVEIHVIDSLDNPVTGASIWVINTLGDTAATGTTDVTGTDSLLVQYELVASGGTTSYNDFTFYAAYGGDTASTTLTVSPSGRIDTVQFAGTVVTGVEAPLKGAATLSGAGKVD